MNYTLAFVKNYTSALASMEVCATLYVRAVRNAMKHGEEEKAARQSFQDTVMASGKFTITPAGWRLLWGVGTGTISPLYLGASYQSHGLTLEALHVPVSVQEDVFKFGIILYDESGHATRRGIGSVQIRHFWQVFHTDGTYRTKEQQIAWIKAHKKERYVKLTREMVRKYLTTKPYPFSKKELRDIARSLED